MTLSEMKICAAETLSFFINSMQDTPFDEDYIIFDFAKKNDMAERAKELCKKYVPDKTIYETQAEQLNESIAANDLIGREKSIVLVRINTKVNKKDFKEIIFHELMHIFCALLEIDGEHFIDIFGNGTTPDLDPKDKIYDGMVSAGYTVWTEFIAHYYALKTMNTERFEFPDVSRYINGLFYEVNVLDLGKSKGSFSMLCSYWLNCTDFEKSLEALSKGTFMPKNQPCGAKTQQALYECLNFLHKQLQKEKPWKITEEFIYQLGFKFNMLRMMNSMLLGIVG